MSSRTEPAGEPLCRLDFTRPCPHFPSALCGRRGGASMDFVAVFYPLQPILRNIHIHDMIYVYIGGGVIHLFETVLYICVFFENLAQITGKWVSPLVGVIPI